MLTLLVWLLSGGASQTLAANGDDHGNNAATATPVGVPSSTLGDIEVGTDVDFFRFNAIAGSIYEFETFLGTLSDSTLTLIAADGITQLAFDDDGGQGLASRITWTAPVPGTYYLEVRAYSGLQTGTYLLQLSADGLLPSATLTVDIVLASISENGGSSTATVTRSSGASGALTVALTSSDVSEATVPATVTIPDGSISAQFTVTGVDDSLSDGTQTVTITASAPGFAGGSDSLDVIDNELLAVDVPSLSTWGLVVMIWLMALFGAWSLRPQKQGGH